MIGVETELFQGRFGVTQEDSHFSTECDHPTGRADLRGFCDKNSGVLLRRNVSADWACLLRWLGLPLRVGESDVGSVCDLWMLWAITCFSALFLHFFSLNPAKVSEALYDKAESRKTECKSDCLHGDRLSQVLQTSIILFRGGFLPTQNGKDELSGCTSIEGVWPKRFLSWIKLMAVAF